MSDGTGYAGSTAWNNAVRSRLVLEQVGKEGPGRSLRVAKANYGAQQALDLYLAGGVLSMTDCADRRELEGRELSAVLTVVLDLLENDTLVVRGNGSGQKPRRRVEGDPRPARPQNHAEEGPRTP